MTTTLICVTLSIPGIKKEGYQFEDEYVFIGDADPRRKQLDELITETFDCYFDRYEYDTNVPLVDYYYATDLPIGIVRAEFERNASLRGIDHWLSTVSV